MGLLYLPLSLHQPKLNITNGTLTFTHNASNIPSPFSVPIIGFGLPFGTPLFVNPYPVNFNTVTVGKTKQCSVPLSNAGTGPLVISSIKILPIDLVSLPSYEPVPPSIIESSGAGFCLPNEETTITIEPNSTYNLIVEFAPTKVTQLEYMSNLSFTHNGAIGIKGAPSPTMTHLQGRTIQVVSTDEPTELPTAYSLSQNYPNPFNPTTKIEYSLMEASNVRLAVYNSLGQEVSNLVNEYQGIGKYTVDFNANNLPSGSYFYKIQVGNFNKTQKMVLMK